jgi:hypothetical protein
MVLSYCARYDTNCAHVTENCRRARLTRPYTIQRELSSYQRPIVAMSIMSLAGICHPAGPDARRPPCGRIAIIWCG